MAIAQINVLASTREELHGPNYVFGRMEMGAKTKLKNTKSRKWEVSASSCIG
jgi:hypothetical protein